MIRQTMDELSKKNYEQGKEILDTITHKNLIENNKEEWIKIGKLTAWFIGILALRVGVDLIKKKFEKK